MYLEVMILSQQDLQERLNVQFLHTVNIDIFLCMNFRVVTKKGIFAWIRCGVL